MEPKKIESIICFLIIKQNYNNTNEIAFKFLYTKKNIKIQNL